MADPEAQPELDELLAEQQRYYRARATTYRYGAPDPGSEPQAEQVIRELEAAIAEHIHGDVAELACGPGTWTGMLARAADSVTALDGSPEMLRIAAATEPGVNVRFAEADIFGWRPERRYDCVFFGFWLSHVPEERFDAFWQTVADALTPGGTVLFVDDGYRGAEELVYGTDSSVIERRGHDGSAFRIIKVALRAERLAQQLTGLGWEVEMYDRDPFVWGIASRGSAPASSPPGSA